MGQTRRRYQSSNLTGRSIISETMGMVFALKQCSIPCRYTMSNGYRPHPLDLSAVPALPSDLEQLVDLLAKNAHDVWARSRISEGWTYGRARVCSKVSLW